MAHQAEKRQLDVGRASHAFNKAARSSGPRLVLLEGLEGERPGARKHGNLLIPDFVAGSREHESVIAAFDFQRASNRSV